MGRIFDAVRALLDAENFTYDAVEDVTALRFGFRTETQQWMCVCEVRETEDLLVFASVLPGHAADEHRPAVAEVMTRINDGLAVGNFEMTWAQGEIRFRTSVDLEGTEVGAPMIRQLLHANLSTVARYIAAVERVARGELAPRAALAGD